MTTQPAQVTCQTHDFDRVRGARNMPLIPQMTAKLHSQIGNETIGRLGISRREHRLLPHWVHDSRRIAAALIELREGIRDERGNRLLACIVVGSGGLWCRPEDRLRQEGRGVKRTDDGNRTLGAAATAARIAASRWASAMDGPRDECRTIQPK